MDRTCRALFTFASSFPGRPRRSGQWTLLTTPRSTPGIASVRLQPPAVTPRSMGAVAVTRFNSLLSSPLTGPNYSASPAAALVRRGLPRLHGPVDSVAGALPDMIAHCSFTHARHGYVQVRAAHARIRRAASERHGIERRRDCVEVEGERRSS
jgi:hypothetical protein